MAGGFTASLSLGTWEPHGDGRIPQRPLQDGAGQRQSPELRVPIGVPRGETLVSRASKSSPAVSGDPKGTGDLGTASCRTLELCQLLAGLQQLPRSRASPCDQGSAARSLHSPWQLPALLGAPGHPPTPPPLFAQPAQGGRHERLSGRVCRAPGEPGPKGLHGPSSPSPAVLPHPQSIRSSLKLGRAPAAPWENLERSRGHRGGGRRQEGEGDVAVSCRMEEPCWCLWAAPAVSPALSPRPPLTPVAQGQAEPLQPPGSSAPAEGDVFGRERGGFTCAPLGGRGAGGAREQEEPG